MRSGISVNHRSGGGLALVALLIATRAFSSALPPFQIASTTAYLAEEGHHEFSRLTPGFYLQILPLGASIVWGYDSVR